MYASRNRELRFFGSGGLDLNIHLTRPWMRLAQSACSFSEPGRPVCHFVPIMLPDNGGFPRGFDSGFRTCTQDVQAVLCAAYGPVPQMSANNGVELNEGTGTKFSR